MTSDYIALVSMPKSLSGLARALIFSNTHAKNHFFNIYFKYRKCSFGETLIPQEFQVNLPEGFNDVVGG